MFGLKEWMDSLLLWTIGFIDRMLAIALLLIKKDLFIWLLANQ
jgi:hypothetical protein